MKLNLLLSIALATALGAGFASARVWTSADGTKTFEGEFKAYDAENKKVTVILRNGKRLTFDVAKLSEKDITFIEEQGKEANQANAGDALKEQAIGAGLTKKGILQILDGKKYKDFTLTKAPEYYILYFGASW